MRLRGLPSSIPKGYLTGVQKREYVNEVNNVPEILIYRGNAERPKFISGGLPHGCVTKRPAREPWPPARLRPGGDSAPEGRAYAPEGSEEKSIIFRLIGLCKGL
ncbi:MAG: hypothetical protein ACQEQO_01675 [Thermodesulfobacteriota bacterium]